MAPIWRTPLPFFIRIGSRASLAVVGFFFCIRMDARSPHSECGATARSELNIPKPHSIDTGGSHSARKQAFCFRTIQPKMAVVEGKRPPPKA